MEREKRTRSGRWRTGMQLKLSGHRGHVASGKASVEMCQGGESDCRY